MVKITGIGTMDLDVDRLLSLEVYIVGGFVRDRLLNRPVSDHDFVVVGSSPTEMLEIGFLPIEASSFPIFIHPNTRDEFALARTERKVGSGYHGFEVNHNKLISIEHDLARRDLTINSMCRRVVGWNALGHAKLSDDIIDPFNGLADLSNGILRHTTDAFVEDPLRILRVARFASRYNNFSVDAVTRMMMQDVVKANEMENLTAERVWVETEKAMTEKFPHRFWEELRECGAMDRLFPAMKAVGPSRWDKLSSFSPELRLPSLTSRCDRMELIGMLDKLKAPTDVTKACLHTNKVTGWLGVGEMVNLGQSDAADLIDLFHNIDAFRNPNTLLNVIIPILTVDGFRIIGSRIDDAFKLAASITFTDIPKDEQKTLKGPEISKRIRQLRINAVEKVL